MIQKEMIEALKKLNRRDYNVYIVDEMAKSVHTLL